MAEHGGYRRPANPAAVSGPGSLSRRTDGGPGQPVMTPTGLPYGEAGANVAAQQGAPMADASDQQAPMIVPLDAETQYPDEPITAGAPFGPGPGPRAQSAGKLTDLLAALLGDDIVGAIEEMYLDAESRGL